MSLELIVNYKEQNLSTNFDEIKAEVGEKDFKMRQFKFRAWLKDDKTMEFVDIIDWNFESISFSKLIPIKESNPEYDEIEVRFDEVELMQFTGLKDREDREIYEGDIVEFEGGVFLVAHDDKNACYALTRMRRGKLKNDRNFNGHAASVCKVVGNIHENPELLGGKNE